MSPHVVNILRRRSVLTLTTTTRVSVDRWNLRTFWESDVSHDTTRAHKDAQLSRHIDLT